MPGIGEIWTGVESLASTGLAKVCADDESSASKLLKGAGDAWKDYTETGDEEGVKKIKNKLGEAFENIADTTPVVGHIKGIVHYCQGDMDKGNKCMESASRSTAVLGVGIATGGAGHAVGSGAGAGVCTGIVYDGLATWIDKGVNGDAATNRGVFGLKDAANSDDPNEVFGALMGPVGDAMAGASANKLGKFICNRGKIASQFNMGEVVTNLKNTAISFSGYVVSDKLKSLFGVQAGGHAFKKDMQQD